MTAIPDNATEPVSEESNNEWKMLPEGIHQVTIKNVDDKEAKTGTRSFELRLEPTEKGYSSIWHNLWFSKTDKTAFSEPAKKAYQAIVKAAGKDIKSTADFKNVVLDVKIKHKYSEYRKEDEAVVVAWLQTASEKPEPKQEKYVDPFEGDDDTPF